MPKTKRDAHLGTSAPRSLEPVWDPRRGVGYDSISTQFKSARDLSEIETLGLYEDGIGRRIVEVPIRRALVGWPRIYVDPSWAEEAEQLESRALELGLPNRVQQALIWADRDSWSLFCIGWGDLAHDLPAPHGKGKISWVRNAYRWDCYLHPDYYGPDSPKFGEPRTARVSRMRPESFNDLTYLPGLGTIHGTRFLRISSPTGSSVYRGISQYLLQILNGGGGISAALAKSVVGVFSVKDWKNDAYRAESDSYQIAKSNFDALSSQNPLILDADDTFRLEGNSSLGSVESALTSLMALLSAASGIPLSELFGLEPGGFSSGKVTERLWLDRLQTERERAERVIRFAYDSLWTEFTGTASHPPYTLEWPPIRRLLPDEQATLITGFMDAAGKAIEIGLTTPANVQAGLASTREVDLWEWTTPAAALASDLEETPDFAVSEEQITSEKWLTAQEIAEEIGSISPAQIRSRRAERPGFHEEGSLDWIRTGRSGGKPLYQLSQVKQAFGIAALEEEAPIE